MRALTAGVALLTLVLASACAPEKNLPRADSSPDQAGEPVHPPVSATAAAAPAVTLPETVAAKAGAPPSSVRRPAPGTSARRGRDTLEYDRAIEYKPRPGTELPAVKP